MNDLIKNIIDEMNKIISQTIKQDVDYQRFMGLGHTLSQLLPYRDVG